MKTFSEKSGLIEPELVELNPTPKEKLRDLEYLTLVGDEPIRRVFVYTGEHYMPILIGSSYDTYTRIHPCHGEGVVKAVKLDRKRDVSLGANFDRGDIELSIGGSRLLGIPKRHYIIYINPLKPDVESNYFRHLVMGNLVGL